MFHSVRGVPWLSLGVLTCLSASAQAETNSPQFRQVVGAVQDREMSSARLRELMRGSAPVPACVLPDPFERFSPTSAKWLETVRQLAARAVRLCCSLLFGRTLQPDWPPDNTLKDIWNYRQERVLVSCHT